MWINKWIDIVWMNKPLVLCTYFVEGFLLYDVFIDVSWLFHPQYHKYLPILWLPYLLMLYFQSFILLSQPCQNWLTLHTPSKLYEERWTCSHRAYQTVSLNLHPVVVTVVITLSLSFLLPQHKEIFKKNTLSKGTPYILFQPCHLHFY